MSTPNPPTLAQVETNARSAFAAALLGGTSTPASVTPAGSPSADAVPQQQQEATPVPEPAPESATPAKAEPAVPATQIDAAKLSDASRRALEMEGWRQDQPVTQELLDKALTRYLEFNNRLGKRGEVTARAAETPPEPPEGEAVTDTLDEETIPQVDPAVIAGAVQQQVKLDQYMQQWMGEWQTNDKEIAGLKEQIKVADMEIMKSNLRLELPEIQSDTTGMAAGEIREEIRNKRADRRDLKDRIRDLEETNADLDASFSERQEQYRQAISGKLAQEREALVSHARIERYTQEMKREWPLALKRVADRHGFTEEDSKELDDLARDAALAKLDRGLGKLENVEVFLDEQATRLKDTWDRHHRRRSAEYALTQKPVPGSPAHPGIEASPAPASPAQAQTGRNTLDDLYRRTRASLQRSLTG